MKELNKIEFFESFLLPENRKAKCCRLIKSKRDARMCAKIVGLYLKYMFEELLQKKEFHIPLFGRLSIVQVPRDPKRLRITPKHYSGDTFLRNERVISLENPGDVFAVKFEPRWPEDKVRFRVHKTFRLKLMKLLKDEEFRNKFETCP